MPKHKTLRRYPCPQGCGRLAAREHHPCCWNCLWLHTQPEGFPSHSPYCDAMSGLTPPKRTYPRRAVLSLLGLACLLGVVAPAAAAAGLSSASLPPSRYVVMLTTAAGPLPPYFSETHPDLCALLEAGLGLVRASWHSALTQESYGAHA
jgi:hypothetical protein